ncbi:Acg family FMN-binding oxidoreductase [Actinomadura sp. NTSP31]|uniref:Acg family FMN-binding oxidoreductase n=1 Tax=Actinomadura sp. NTSP31 TaxID=1735447 RepID=UPI0035C1D1E3
MHTSDSAAIGRDVLRGAVEDAIRAPSVHNTQPWRFSARGSRISLRADPDRRLDVADPQGREMLISCGAALYNLRLSLRKRGYEPDVRLLPDVDRPNLLADVEVEPDREPVTREIDGEYAQIERRHSHRGGFRPGPVPPGLPAALRLAAEQEGARVVQAVDVHVKGALAALTDAAEHVQRRTSAYSTEIARWAPSPTTARKDGVQPVSYPRRTPRTEPHFPPRDFARGQGWGVEPADDDGIALTGIAVLLVTAEDTPAAWLHAGQALERMLLRAAQDDLSAAFHTQAMQVPELRAFIRTHFCGDAHPQMLLRIGVPAGEELATVRRPVEDVMLEEP